MAQEEKIIPERYASRYRFTPHGIDRTILEELGAAESSLSTQAEEMRGWKIIVTDLRMIVQRLCRKVPDVSCGVKHPAVVSSLDYLKRKGLQGSCLRSEYTEGAATQEGEA